MGGAIRLYFKNRDIGRGIVCSNVCYRLFLNPSLSIPLFWCVVSLMPSCSAPWSKVYSQYELKVHYTVRDLEYLEYHDTQAKGPSLGVYGSKN